MMPHNLILEDRKRMMVSGVQDVDCFDEESIILFTNMGRLVVQGQNLHVNSFDVESGEFFLEGDVHSLNYTEGGKEKKTFFSRLFR